MEEKNVLERAVSRRSSLKFFGAAGAVAIVGLKSEWASLLGPAARRDAVVTADTLSCVARPEVTEGPFFVDERLNRSDIRSDPMTGSIKPGVPLALTFSVHSIDDDCGPIAGAYVDVWHTDALGSYSDVASEGTAGQKYLRGYQVTDENGQARFTTIYPGWYRGRTTHIHFKIRVFTNGSQSYEFTSQLFFDESVTNQVATASPYSQQGTPDTTNARDGIYNGGNAGPQLMLDLSQSGGGYAGTFSIGLRGVPATGGGETGEAPSISSVAMRGKKLVVTGSNFGTGAVIVVDGADLANTKSSVANPSTVLTAKRAARLVAEGQTVAVQVRNAYGALSPAFAFTRPST